MKTIALTLTFPLMLASVALAQNTSTNTNTANTGAATTATTATTTTTQRTEVRTSDADRIVMSSGALVEIKGDQAARVNSGLALGEGIHVTPGGTVTYSNGTTATLRDGQMLTPDGKIAEAPADQLKLARAALDAGTAGPGGHAPGPNGDRGGSATGPITAPVSTDSGASMPSGSGGASGGNNR